MGRFFYEKKHGLTSSIQMNIYVYMYMNDNVEGLVSTLAADALCPWISRSHRHLYHRPSVTLGFLSSMKKDSSFLRHLGDVK